MLERLRCGVIGTGACGQQLLNNLFHCPRVTAVAIAENDPGRARHAADRFRIARSYTNYQELLDQPDLDAVVIAVPNHLHATIAVEALRSRKHVLVVPPLCLNAKEAAKIAEATRKVRRVLMVAASLRWNHHTQAARLAIEHGTLGEVYHSRCFWLRHSGIPRIGSWFTRKQFSGGGALMDLGAQILDLCLHLLGDFDVKSVSASSYSRFGPRGQGEANWGKGSADLKRAFDVEDHGSALLRLKSGKTISLDASWAGNHAPDGREHGLDLLGEKAGLSLFPAKIYRTGSGGYETVHLSPPMLAHPEDAVHQFVSWVIDGRKPNWSLEETVRLHQILDAIYASASAGREVKVE